MSTLPHMIRRSPSRPSRRRVRSLVLLGGGLSLFLLGAAAVPQPAIVDGVTLSVPATGFSEGDLTSLRDVFLEEPITLDAGAVVLHRSRLELGASLERKDLETALAKARSASGGAFGPSLDRLRGRAPASVRWVPRVDERLLFTALAALRSRIDETPPAPLRLRLDDPVAGRQGRALDVTAAVRVVRGALAAGETYVELPVLAIDAPDRPMPTLASAEFAHVLGSHTSRFSSEGDSWTRASNLERAARALDDTVLPPGATLSFNDIVGDRTLGRGYLPAPEASNGELVLGIGGGICQVALGIFEAAERAGLVILEQHAHSTHDGEGVDIAVAFGVKDLRIANPYRFPTRLDIDTRSGELRVTVESTYPVATSDATAEDEVAEEGRAGSMQ